MMWVTILGRRYRFRFTGSLPKGCHGECDDPLSPGKEIRIKRGLSAKDELETIIHEALHASDWHKEEIWVQKVAEDIARILWRLNFRRQTEDVDDDPA